MKGNGKNGKRIVEKYKFNQITIEIEETPHGYDVIYRSFINSKHLLKDAALADAYAYIAGYFYSLLRYLKAGCNYGNN